MITLVEYEEAIVALRNAITQLQPDGENCAVCGDSGHQAGECRHNPLVLARRYSDLRLRVEALHDELHRAFL